MLTATSKSTYGESRILTAVFLERRFRAHLLWRHRMLFDSRFQPQASSESDIVTVYMSLEGSVEVKGQVTTSPIGFALHESEFERVAPDAATFRSWGDPAVVFNLRLPRADLRVPAGLDQGPLKLSTATWDAMAALAEATGVGVDVATPTLALVRSLGEDGIIAYGIADECKPESALVQRLWKSVAPYYERLATGYKMADLVESRRVSVRQAGRELASFVAAIPMLGGGFRDSVLVMRLRLAVLLLSQPEASLAEIATWVGYASVDNMSGAFRDAGLPPPSTIRAAVRFPD